MYIRGVYAAVIYGRYSPMDIVTAFLNSDVDTGLYMRQPRGSDNMTRTEMSWSVD